MKSNHVWSWTLFFMYLLCGLLVGTLFGVLGHVVGILVAAKYGSKMLVKRGAIAADSSLITGKHGKDAKLVNRISYALIGSIVIVLGIYLYISIRAI